MALFVSSCDRALFVSSNCSVLDSSKDISAVINLGSDKTPASRLNRVASYGAMAARAGSISSLIPFAWFPKQPSRRMLSQDLGHGEFITGITPHERSYSGSLRQWDA